MTKTIIHNEQNAELAIINLPIELLRLCKDKDSCLRVALSMFIKAHNGDSIIRNVSVRNLIKTLHVGQKKASECLAVLENDKDFFMPTREGSFIARTFKNKIKKSRNRNNNTIYSCYCYKMTVYKCWSLGEIMRRLRSALIVYAINSNEKREMSLDCKKTTTSSNNSSNWVTFSKLSNITGYSRTTARRKVYGLEGEGKIAIKKGKFEVVASTSDEGLSYYGLDHRRVVTTKNGYALLFTPNEYRIIDRKLSGSFVNIIYNHSKRWTRNISKDNVCLMDSELMAAYN